jgi:hypothetical protein
MERLRILIFCLIFIFISVSGIKAQSAPTTSATGHVTAEVIPVFSATETSQLNFGRFSPGPQGGEILLTPESTISVVGSVFAGSGLHNAASFYVSGDEDASFTITLPDNPVVLRHVSSAKTMVIENWISNPGTGTGAGILQDGFQVVNVGATLKVGTLNDNPVGVYAGTYNVTFDFN